MIREGDNFDYGRWLKEVREEEAQAKQVPTAIIPRDVVTSDSRDARPSLGPALISKRALSLRALPRPHRQAKSKNPKARLRQWLETGHQAWGEFQASRRRDAVYGYLKAVFGIVMHYKVRRRSNRLLRHAFDFADLPFDKNADPFSAVIRCTSGRDIESKTISKWSRALRYVARSKVPDIELSTFMKEAGGVNACADRYAGLMRHC
jgi:hypothetical protein